MSANTNFYTSCLNSGIVPCINLQRSFLLTDASREGALERQAGPLEEQRDVLLPLKGAQLLKPLRVHEVVQRRQRLHAQAAQGTPISNYFLTTWICSIL